jgi:N-methylhydantoinase B
MDPIRVEVIRNALSAATEVMGSVLRRTAHSTNVKTRADFSCALFDARLRTIAQAFAQPMHLSSMAMAVPQAVTEAGRVLGEGDSLVFNYVPRGGVHLNDIIVLSAVYCDDELVGYVGNIAHHVDVGGMAAGSLGLSTEIFQEGMIIPPVLVERRGVIDEDVHNLITSNVRSPREMFGDLRAQIGANRVGADRFTEVVRRWGAREVAAAIDSILDATELETRRAISSLPDGEFGATGQVDDDGLTDEPIRLVVKVQIDGSTVRFDTTGSDPQRRSPMGATYASCFSGCAYVLKSLLLPDSPVNDGFYRAIEVISPPGTVLHVTHPGPVAGGGELCMSFVDTVIKAFAQILPDRVIACGKGCLGNITFGGVNPRTGEFYAFYETIGGGYGARPTKDGMEAVQTHMSNAENAPVEIVESQYPFRNPRYELIPDSAGLGTYRGGLGNRRDYAFDHEVSFSILSDRGKTGPWGIFGGEGAHPARYILNPDGDEPRDLPSKRTVTVQPGETVSVQTPGGGGYGPLSDRSPELIARDRRSGKITRVGQGG